MFVGDIDDVPRKIFVHILEHLLADVTLNACDVFMSANIGAFLDDFVHQFIGNGIFVNGDVGSDVVDYLLRKRLVSRHILANFMPKFAEFIHDHWANIVNQSRDHRHLFRRKTPSCGSVLIVQIYPVECFLYPIFDAVDAPFEHFKTFILVVFGKLNPNGLDAVASGQFVFSRRERL